MIELRRQNGFSLVEVLVAFAFLALVGTALYRVFSGALINVLAAEDYTRAALIAESRIAGLGFEKAIAAGTEAGQTEGDKFQWTVDVVPFVSATPASVSAGTVSGGAYTPGAKLVEVVAKVSWEGPRETRREVVLATMRLVPGE